jgi:hypothetical protein
MHNRSAGETGMPIYRVKVPVNMQPCRTRQAQVFTSGTDNMVQFLWQDDLVSVALFVADS